MTLEQIKVRMKELITQREEFCNPINKELGELEDLRVKLVPKIMDFSEHEGKYIRHICAVDSNGNDVYLPCDEIMQVKDGKPYFSSYNGGIVYFDEEKQKYARAYYGNRKEVDIVGFYDVCFEDEEDEDDDE